jgi:hypothetical protein
MAAPASMAQLMTRGNWPQRQSICSRSVPEAELKTRKATVPHIESDPDIRSIETVLVSGQHERDFDAIKVLSCRLRYFQCHHKFCRLRHSLEPR